MLKYNKLNNNYFKGIANCFLNYFRKTMYLKKKSYSGIILIFVIKYY